MSSRPTGGTSGKARRREEGEIRNAMWRALTTAEKVASLLQRRGESRRQLTELLEGVQA